MSLTNKIDNTLNKWMKGAGPGFDVVISSRVRLARNIMGVPFPKSASFDDSKRVVEKVKNRLDDQQNQYQLKLLKLEKISQLEKEVMVEKHLISPEHAQAGQNKAVALTDDESISIMVNEEDHIRIQTLLPGLQLSAAWQLSNEVDDYLESQLNFAFDESYGYLTACPTNAGTGMRASVMLHLPALSLTQRINDVLRATSQLGLAVRGLYGEGTEAIGNLYQVSNQVTLGATEEEIIENLEGVITQIIEQERNAREVLLKENELELSDRVYRSYGILAYARKISIQEAMKLISDLRLGIDLGVMENISENIFNELIVLISSAALQRLEGKSLTSSQREQKRAELIRERIT